MPCCPELSGAEPNGTGLGWNEPPPHDGVFWMKQCKFSCCAAPVIVTGAADLGLWHTWLAAVEAPACLDWSCNSPSWPVEGAVPYTQTPTGFSPPPQLLWLTPVLHMRREKSRLALKLWAFFFLFLPFFLQSSVIIPRPDTRPLPFSVANSPHLFALSTPWLFIVLWAEVKPRNVTWRREWKRNKGASSRRSGTPPTAMCHLHGPSSPSNCQRWHVCYPTSFFFFFYFEYMSAPKAPWLNCVISLFIFLEEGGGRVG